MKLSDLLNNVEVLELHADPELEVAEVCYDSRKAGPGCLFVAVTGMAVDGHRFIPAACAAGAAVIVCEHAPEQEIPYVLVASSRAALAGISANWFCHPTKEMKIIGITGTNGKTTVSYLIRSVLVEALGAKVGLIGTIQNMIGDEVLETERTTPESYELQKLFRQMADAGCTHVVMEVSSHALALNRVDAVKFEVGVFTNLTQDHLDFHGNMQNYGLAKALLFQRCRHGVMNLDDEAFGLMRSRCTCTRLAYAVKDQEAGLKAENIQLKADCVEMDVSFEGESKHVTLPIPGEFSVYNAMAAIGTALKLGIDLQSIADALKNATGVKGRVEVVPTPGMDFTILIDYAHTPDGLENVLRCVRGFCQGRLICLFGCGGDRDPIKRPIMGAIAAQLSDFVVVTSDNPRTEEPDKIIADILAGMQDAKTPYTVIENRREAIRWAMDHAKKDDIIVLAGKGHETYQILGHEKTHLDEREEVVAHLEVMKKEQIQ